MRNVDVALGSGTCAGVFEHSCLLQCARMTLASICSGVTAPLLGHQGLAWRAAAGAVALHPGDRSYGRALAPSQCRSYGEALALSQCRSYGESVSSPHSVLGTDCFASLCLNLHVCKTGGTIIPEQPNPQGCILSLRKYFNHPIKWRCYYMPGPVFRPAEG